MMYAATANGTAVDRLRATPQMTARRPKVATSSLKNCAPPARAWRDAVNTASPKHSVGDCDPAEGAGDLGQDVAWNIAPPGVRRAPQSAKRHRRVEVSARDRPEGQE